MKKLLIGLMFLGYLPYLFLATEVILLPETQRAYKCHLKDGGEASAIVAFGSVYYDPIGKKIGKSNHYKVLPYFFQKANVSYLTCGDKTVGIGHIYYDKAYYPGVTIHAQFTDIKVTLFGIELFRETGVQGFRSNGKIDTGEGQEILTKIVNDKEVQFFDGKPVIKGTK